MRRCVAWHEDKEARCDEPIYGRLETDPKPTWATHALGGMGHLFSGEDVRTRPMPPNASAAQSSLRSASLLRALCATLHVSRPGMNEIARAMISFPAGTQEVRVPVIAEPFNDPVSEYTARALERIPVITEPFNDPVSEYTARAFERIPVIAELCNDPVSKNTASS